MGKGGGREVSGGVIIKAGRSASRKSVRLESGGLATLCHVTDCCWTPAGPLAARPWFVIWEVEYDTHSLH